MNRSILIKRHFYPMLLSAFENLFLNFPSDNVFDRNIQLKVYKTRFSNIYKNYLVFGLNGMSKNTFLLKDCYKLILSMNYIMIIFNFLSKFMNNMC